MRSLVLPLLILLVACGGEDKPAGSTPGGSSAPEDSGTSDTGTASDDTGGDPCDLQPEVTWSGWAQGFFRGYCTSCHSRTTPDRWGAPEGLNFDTEEDVVSRVDQIRSAVLESDRMPVGGGVLASDLELLEVYLDCGL